MEQPATEIINIYLRKISLFQDLLNCVIRERENLITQDIKGIWSSLEEKESILASIDVTKHQLGGGSGSNMNLRDFSPVDREKINELSRTLVRLRLEIKTRVKENMSFINETLDFFHEMISAMTTSEADKCNNSYGPSGNSRKGARSLIYQSEA
jgi:hypothetical protein